MAWLKHAGNARLEMIRGESMVDYFEPEQSMLEQQSINTASVSENEMSFDNEEDEFCFNDIIRDKSRNEKAKAFLHLLKQCNNGKIICDQKVVYGDILCFKV
ncbi:unnamed protein product [Didymodactylos carnosus]|uniref:Rad21/Rec8-like protein C-terminal eukaryotic domain-containing protein n=1 Tax=Didymodactylos carnosus TaxID=1234261 RepID=A0A815CX50_9BILA|nr:unnamed protein product [Didymodactylos carnosus]CAF4102133.1 unnamed protein product [Didymodactylos carnosus]